MSLSEQILNAMKEGKADSKNPISCFGLWMKLGLGKSVPEFDVELDRMYACTPPLVNRAKITRGGVTAMGYWPTGMVQAANYSTNFSKKPPTKVLREEMQQTQPIKEETPAMTTETNQNDSTELKLLTHIKANPKCTLSAAERATKTNLNCACTYLKWYFDQGFLVREPYQNTKLISFSAKADELTLAQLYALKQKEKPARAKPGRKQAKDTSEAAKEFNHMAMPSSLAKAIGDTEEVAKKPAEVEEFEIPAFLRKSEQETPAPAETKPAALETRPATDYGDFKIAYTSNGTLIFFGLQYSPIELSVKQTHLLNDFMNESVVIE